jgi:hypothetical protein
VAVGDTTASSILWVAGEATGKDIYGAVHALPVDIEVTLSGGAGDYAASARAAVVALQARLVASGYLPS